MPDWLQAGLGFPGLGWLFFGAIAAGLVRGFTGFGTAMVYIPVASQVLSPIEALTTLLIMDFFGPLAALRPAWRDAAGRELATLTLAMLVALPLGLLFLTSVNPEVFRYAVSLIALVLLGLLIGGARYRGPFGTPLLLGTGGLSGLLGGAVGLGGPPVIMLYMASTRPAAAIRANTLIFLFLTDVGMILMLGVAGLLASSALVIGCFVAIPYSVSLLVGAQLFRPEAEHLYRRVAYAVIGLSALSGLPLFD